MIKIEEQEKQVKKDNGPFGIPHDHLNIDSQARKEGFFSRARNTLSFSNIIILVAAIIVIVSAIFLQVGLSSLNAEISELRIKINTMDTANLKSRIDSLESRLDSTNKEYERHKIEVAHLKSELDSFKSSKQKAITTPRATPKQPVKKGKPVKTGTRQRPSVSPRR